MFEDFQSIADRTNKILNPENKTFAGEVQRIIQNADGAEKIAKDNQDHLYIKGVSGNHLSKKYLQKKFNILSKGIQFDDVYYWYECCPIGDYYFSLAIIKGTLYYQWYNCVGVARFKIRDTYDFKDQDRNIFFDSTSYNNPGGRIICQNNEVAIFTKEILNAIYELYTHPPLELFGESIKIAERDLNKSINKLEKLARFLRVKHHYDD